MDPLYDIFFQGELLPGSDADTVKSALAKLFKADADTIERLFSGKPVAVKRGCDKDTALRYKKGMEQAGARPVIRKAAGTAPAETAATTMA